MIALKLLLISTLFLPIFMDTLSEWEKRKRIGMENAKSLHGFIFYALQTNRSTDMSFDYADQEDVHKRCNITEQCKLVPICESVEPDPDNPDSKYYPKCVELTRCIDSSHDHTKYCLPSITIVNKMVVQHKFDGRENIIYKRLVPKQNHTSCRLETKSSKLNREGISLAATTRVKTCRENRCSFYSNEDEIQMIQDSCSADMMIYNDECCICDPVE